MTTEYNKTKLFNASCIALIVTAMAFGLRAGMVGTWAEEFSLNIEQIGWINGTAFYGFTLAMMFGGPLCDVLGMKRLLYIAFFGHFVGTVLTFTSSGFWPLYMSTLFIGIANGMVEAACNPLVATLYPQSKTKMLNKFHVWFPGGIVIGGLLGYLMSQSGLGWQVQIATMLIPTLIYGYMIFSEKFPATERVASGVSTSGMFSAAINPLFIFMVVCMFITASTELGTNQLIGKLLESTGISPMLVLVYISGLMMLGRTFAGNVVHALSPAGMLLFSAIFSALGLFGLSMAVGTLATFGAATVFAIGICFFWPTMLGFVSEYMPNTSALGLPIMGGAGMLSVSFVLPILVGFLDQQSGAATLRGFAILPTVLVLAFGGLYFLQKNLKSAHS